MVARPKLRNLRREAIEVPTAGGKAGCRLLSNVPYFSSYCRSYVEAARCIRNRFEKPSYNRFYTQPFLLQQQYQRCSSNIIVERDRRALGKLCYEVSPRFSSLTANQHTAVDVVVAAGPNADDRGSLVESRRCSSLQQQKATILTAL